MRDAAGHYVYGRRMQYIVMDPAVAGNDAARATEQPERPRLSHAGNALIALDTGRPNHIFDAPAAGRVTARSARATAREPALLRMEHRITPTAGAGAGRPATCEAPDACRRFSSNARRRRLPPATI